MYFSAACLIGLRPLFSKMPKRLRDRIMHPSDHTNGMATYRNGGTLQSGGHIKATYGRARTYHSFDDRQRDPYATLEDGRGSENSYPMGTITHAYGEAKLNTATSDGSGEELPQHTVTATTLPPPAYRSPVHGNIQPHFGTGLGGGRNGRSHDNIYIDTSIEVHQERYRQVRRN